MSSTNQFYDPQVFDNDNISDYPLLSRHRPVPSPDAAADPSNAPRKQTAPQNTPTEKAQSGRVGQENKKKKGVKGRGIEEESELESGIENSSVAGMARRLEAERVAREHPELVAEVGFGRER